MRALLVLLVACGAPRATEPPTNVAREPPPAPPPSKFRVARPFKLQVFELEVKNPASADEAMLGKRLTTGLREVADLFDGITVAPSPFSLADAESVTGCVRTAPGCLRRIARSVGIDRIVFGTIEGSNASLTQYIRATDVSVAWSSDKLVSDERRLRALGLEALQFFFSQ